MGSESLLEAAVAEVCWAEVAMCSTLARDVSQRLGHCQVLLHVADGLQVTNVHIYRILY